jgi:hypothetical protein
MIMIGLFLDAVILFGIIYALLGEDAPEFVHILLVALGIAVANVLCSGAFYFLLGITGLIVLIPQLIIDGLILMYFCALTLKQSAIAVAALLVCKFVLAMLLR